MHRVRAGQVGADLGDGPLLRARQRERQRVVETTDQRTVDVTGDMANPLGLPLQCALAHHQDHLEPEELVERKTVARRFLGFHATRARGSA